MHLVKSLKSHKNEPSAKRIKLVDQNIIY